MSVPRERASRAGESWALGLTEHPRVGGPVPCGVTGSASPPDGLSRPTPTPVRGAALTDRLVAQHGVEEAHLHLRAPHHRLLSRARGCLAWALVARGARATHLGLPHGRRRATSARREKGYYRLRAGALGVEGAHSLDAACPRPRRRNEGWLPVQQRLLVVDSFTAYGSTVDAPEREQEQTLRFKNAPGVVTHSFNPSPREGEAGGSL